MKKENFVKVLVLIGLVGLAGCAGGNGQTSNVSDSNGSNSTTNPAGGTQQAADVKVYEATADYDTPGGPETLDVQVSLDASKNISDVSFVGTTNNPKSRIYQSLFLEGIKQEIVGKSLADVGQYTVVNGSSLTSAGFNKAIAQIKSEAV